VNRVLAAVLIVLTLAVAAVAQPAPSVGEVDRAVVLISVLVQNGGRTVRGSGSGIIIESDGLILTAAHVVNRAESMEVTLWTGQSLPARLVGSDPLFDAALIRVDASAPLPTARLGTAVVLDAGSPLTALGRAPRRQAGPTSGAFIDIDVDARPGVPNLRASTRVWPGDSGGAMLDSRGEVVGLIVAVTRDGAVSLSLSVDAVKRLLPDLVLGAVRHPWIGISGRTLTPELADALGLAGRNGVVVIEAVPGGPAAAAGVRGSGVPASGEIPRGGDLIVAIDGHPVTTFGGMAAYVLSRRVGDAVTVQLLRGGETLAFTVVLGERPNV
jgi:S1-C subfamily serine protease